MRGLAAWILLVVGVGAFSIDTAAAQANKPQRQPDGSSQANSSSSGQSLSGGKQSLRDERAETDDPRARLEADRRNRGGPNTDFKRQLLRQRDEQTARNAAADAFASSPAPVWVPIGPTGADYEQNGAYTGIARDSGRVRTILPHPTDPKTVYLLTSGGGLWVTHTFTSSIPSWRPLTDSQVTTGGGSVAFGRTPNVLYLGLGDPFDIVNVGGAMLKSTNSGASWTHFVDLGAPLSVRDVKVDFSASQDIVLVATDSGLFRSTNAGTSYVSISAFQGLSVWSLVQTAAGWLANAQPCNKVPATFCGTQATIYLSSDHGATWSPIPNTGNGYAGAGRTTLAVASPADNIVYAFAENSASLDQLDLFRSTDGGLTWSALGINAKSPTNPNSDNPNMDLMHGQSWYNQMLLVDSRDATRNTIYLGGNLSSAKSTDGGATWTLLSNWLYGHVSVSGTPALMPYVHADMHAAALSTAGTPVLIFGTDGGLFVSSDDGSTWSSDKNNGLQTFLFYSLISNPVYPATVMAGAQDNGTRVRKGNTSIYNQSQGGDGVATGWSQANNNFSMTTVPYNKYYENFTSQVPTLSQNFLSVILSNGSFYTPLETPTATVDPTGSVFFGETTSAVWKTANGGWNWSPIGIAGSGIPIPSGINLGDGPHAVGVSPIDLLHVAAVAHSGHLELTTDGGNTWTDRPLSTLVPGGFSFAASVTWADNQTIYVPSRAALPGVPRVAKSTDGGNSWARADGGLPDVPINRVVVDPRDATKNTLLAASDLGVFRSTDGGANWSTYGSGLPNVAVFDLYIPPDGGFIRIATYGRGVWELPSLEFVSATLSAASVSCDKDTALDNGGTANLLVTLKNGGAIALSNVTATVTSTNSAVSFPNGNTIAFPAAGANTNTSGSIAVGLNGAVGIQQIDFTVAFTDPSLNITSPVKALASVRANFDETRHGSTSETFEASVSPWTTSGTPEALPDVSAWHIRQISPVEHRAVAIASNAIADEALISPVMSVGTGPFSFSFEQRYLFEYDGSPAWYDGMVVEISSDGGASWADIGAAASPGYDHVLYSGSGNPLSGRSAYSGLSANYPGFTTVNVSLGTSYAGKNVQIRFRVGTDNFIGRPGVEIRNFTTANLTNKPFTAVVKSKGVCAVVTDTITSSPNPSTSGSSVAFTATIAGGSTVATGSVVFKDGAATLGTGTLNSSAQATLNIATLSVGSHSVTASYSGDPTHAATTSTALTQVVN